MPFHLVCQNVYAIFRRDKFSYQEFSTCSTISHYLPKSRYAQLTKLCRITFLAITFHVSSLISCTCNLHFSSVFATLTGIVVMRLLVQFILVGRHVCMYFLVLHRLFFGASFNPRVRVSPPPDRNNRTTLPITNRNPNIFTVISSLRFFSP